MNNQAPTTTQADGAKSTSRPRRAALVMAFLALAVTAGSADLPVAATPPTADSSIYAGMPEPEPMVEPSAVQVAPSTQDATAFTLSATTLRFRIGKHTLYKFNTSGAIARTRNVSFDTARSYEAAADATQQAGGSYVRLTGGKHQDWWAATPAVTPGSLVEFATQADVTLKGGTHIGFRFHAAMRLQARLSATLSASATYKASRQGTFGTKTYFFLTSGPLAGRWVARSSNVTLIAPAAETPIASTPSATWKTLVLVYRETDVTFKRSDGSNYHLQSRMSDEVYAASLKTVRRTVTTINTWSAGLAALDMQVVEVPHALTALDPLWDGYWVGPSSVRSDLNAYAPAGKFDSIFVIWHPRDDKGVRVPVAGWGLTLGPGPWANGAGFSSVTTPNITSLWTTGTNPDEVFVHEWLHQILIYHETAGRLKLDLHANLQYGYEPQSGSYQRWYTDILQGKVKDGTSYNGVNAANWAADQPTK